MKTTLSLIPLLFALNLLAATNSVQFNLGDILTSVQTLQRKTVQLIPESTVRTNTNNVIVVSERRFFNTGTNGSFTATNVVFGNYLVEVWGQTYTSRFRILVPDTAANFYASDLITTSNSVPSESAGFTQAQANNRFVLKNSGWASNLTVTNLAMPVGAVDGYVWTVTNSNGRGEWRPPTGGGSMAAKTNGVSITGAANTFDFIEGTNVVIRATNAAGVVTVQINAAGSGDAGGTNARQGGHIVLTNLIGTVSDNVTNVNEATILYVRTNGNNSTAIRGRMDKPYAHLSNAVLSAVYGDVIDMGAGVWIITNQSIRIPNGVSVRGKGRGQTVIHNALNWGSSGPAIVPGSDSKMERLTGTNITPSIIQVFWGVNNGVSVQPAFTNAILTDVEFRGDSDCVYVLHTTPCYFRVLNSEFFSKWDTMVLESGAHIGRFFLCNLLAIGPSVHTPSAACYGARIASGGARGEFFGSTLIASNSSSSNIGLNNNGEQALAYNCFIQATGTGALDVFGDCELDNPFNFDWTKIIGNPKWAKTNSLIPAGGTNLVKQTASIDVQGRVIFSAPIDDDFNEFAPFYAFYSTNGGSLLISNSARAFQQLELASNGTTTFRSNIVVALSTNALVSVGAGGVLRTNPLGANLSMAADGTLSASGSGGGGNFNINQFSASSTHTNIKDRPLMTNIVNRDFLSVTGALAAIELHTGTASQRWIFDPVVGSLNYFGTSGYLGLAGVPFVNFFQNVFQVITNIEVQGTNDSKWTTLHSTRFEPAGLIQRGTNNWADGGTSSFYSNVFNSVSAGLTNVYVTNIDNGQKIFIWLFPSNGVTVAFPQFAASDHLDGSTITPATNIWSEVEITRRGSLTNINVKTRTYGIDWGNITATTNFATTTITLTAPDPGGTNSRQGGSLTLTNLSGTGAITNLYSKSLSNATMVPLLFGGASGASIQPTNTTGALYGLEAGANVTLTPNGSNIVVASSASGGGGTNFDSIIVTNQTFYNSRFISGNMVATNIDIQAGANYANDTNTVVDVSFALTNPLPATTSLLLIGQTNAATNHTITITAAGGATVNWGTGTNGSVAFTLFSNSVATIFFKVTTNLTGTNILASLVTDSAWPQRNQYITASAGAGKSNIWVGGRLYYDTRKYTNLNSTATTFTNLATNIISGLTHTNIGDISTHEWTGRFQNSAASTNNFQVIFGSETPFDSGLQIASNTVWRVTTKIIVLGDTSQLIDTRLEWGPGGGVPFAFTNVLYYAAQTNGVDTGIALRGASRRGMSLTNELYMSRYDPAPK